VHTIRQSIQPAIDLAGDLFALVPIGKHVQFTYLPEPRRRLGRPLRLLEQLRCAEQTFVAEQSQAAAQVVAATGNLDQPSTTVTLAIVSVCGVLPNRTASAPVSYLLR